MESQSAVSHVMQHTNTQAGTTTLGRVPCCLTFKATDVAETAVIDHGSHNVDIPIKQPRGWGRTQDEERSCDRAEDQGAK